MNEISTKPLSDTEEKTIAAAIRCFVRFGARKTSMNDIAAEAGVSRQTLYDLFGGKDEMIRASIRSITDQNLAMVRQRLAECATLSEKLDAYFEETVIKSFEMLQNAGDAKDLITGHNAAGKDEIARSHDRHEALIAEILEPYADAMEQHGLSVPEQAHFFVTVVMGLKYGARDRSDLESLIAVLKTNCLISVEH